MRELPSGHIERLDIRRRGKNHVERIQVPGIETIDETLLSSDGSAGPGAGMIDVFAMNVGHGIFQKIRWPTECGWLHDSLNERAFDASLARSRLTSLQAR